MSQDTVNLSGLEDQLRGMILGNVTIAGGQTNHDSHQGQYRGRGRGRGGFHRGSGPNSRGGHAPYNNNYNVNNTRGDQPYGMNTTPPSTRGGRPDTHTGTGPRHQQHHTYVQPRSNGPPSNVAHASQPPGYYNQHQAPRVMHRPQNGFNQAGQAPRGGGPHQYPRPSYAQNGYQNQPRIDTAAQVNFMENVIEHELPKVEMSEFEVSKHTTFRKGLEIVMREALFESDIRKDQKEISLVAFGSLGSGFALPGSDMDLAVVSNLDASAQAGGTDIGTQVPRILEKVVLDAKMGGRLLTRTRVPILKVCEHPTPALYTALVDERKKWEDLPEQEKYPEVAPKSIEGRPIAKPTERSSVVLSENTKTTDATLTATETATATATTTAVATETETATTASKETVPTAAHTDANNASATPSSNKEHQNRPEKQWHREKVLGPLDFPKSGVGIQCDINFANPLGIHNTHMLRCYSLTDARVRPMVLFVKSWAKRRKINSSYSGTLSSYGWVLMVLHYLVNVASPPVCPNLQHYLPQTTDINSLTDRFKDAKIISGYDVRFWNNEQEIIQAAQDGRLTQNRQSLAALLCGFFRYFASQGGPYGRQQNFHWTSEVLSLRTPSGILSKQEKGWVSATTIVTAEKKVTNRYLFAIEDPFEIDHNVARTVTHRGIVTIRDEFRRAGRILNAVGRGMEPEGGFFDELVEEAPASDAKVEKLEHVVVPSTDRVGA